MLLSQLQEDSRFLRLTEPQKAFVRHYCETQDKVASAHKAWNCKDDSSATTMANRLLGSAPVGQLVSLFVDDVDHRVTREEVLSILGKRLRACTDDELTLEFVERISKIEGWETKASSPPAPKGQTGVSELVAQMEK